MYDNKKILLFGLYITQFLGLSFITQGIPTIMRENGSDLTDISMIHLIGVFWSLKLLWSPIIDRFSILGMSHYKGWIITMQILMISSLFLSSSLNLNSKFSILLIVFCFFSLFSATQDIASDALAINILKPEERGIGNSIQISGGSIGILLGGGGLLIAYDWLGWEISLYILALATFIPLVFISRYNEPFHPQNKIHLNVRYKDIFLFFKRVNSLSWVGVLLTFQVGTSITSAIVSPLLVDIGWSLKHIGFVIGILGSLLAMIGALSAGLLVGWVGRKQTMLFCKISTLISSISLIPISAGIENNLFVYFGICLMFLSFGAGATVLSTVMMDKSESTKAGTDYTLQYTITSTLGLISSSLALMIAEKIGYSGVLFISILATIGALFVVYKNNNIDSF
ncbi:MFS transporter [Vibrio sp. WJH972]